MPHRTHNVGAGGTSKSSDVGVFIGLQNPAHNNIVEPLHEKAMPVLIRTKDEAEQWLEAPAEEAMKLQKPAPDDASVLLPETKEAA